MSRILFVHYEPSEAQKATPREDRLSSAARINQLEDFRWKFWIKGVDDDSLGGIYLFDTIEAARAWGEDVKARLTAGGGRNVSLRYFDFDGELSGINRAPVAP